MDKDTRKIVWDEYALRAVETHAQSLKTKAEEIAARCNLPTVNDYTVNMAIKELQQSK